ncbi:MAG: ATP-grasp domain-containing protein [Alphaproteobacteria bacterium]|nr:ATP-grasp domain-containing protein [Alphaproteobacteria bacterium]
MSALRLFIANRGEIAIRVIDACQSLGIETVLGVSSADKDTLGAARATHCVTLGGARAAHSYLNQAAIIHAARMTGCKAIHPGYGFLSERADFARACADHGLTFIGASPEQLETLGDKLIARAFAQSVGVPVSPGGPTSSLEEARIVGGDLGYPLLIKAAFGGGGRGMKLVEQAADLADAWTIAASEAAAAFGDGTVFIERFVRAAKHIEVQILGDGRGHCIHLGERECSLQFRYQKMLEEAPSSALRPEHRTLLHSYALRIGRGLNCLGLATVEFLFDVEQGAIWFLEVNPRIQVEHPVTEAVTGIDLVREQILLALGEPMRLMQDDIKLEGHAVELRLTAQDPAHRLKPSPGVVRTWRPPLLGGVRWDTHIYEGYHFPPYYDALMAKIIAYGHDRATALSRATRAITELQVSGLATNAALLRHVLASPAITGNLVTTRWLEEQLAKGAFSQ